MTRRVLIVAGACTALGLAALLSLTFIALSIHITPGLFFHYGTPTFAKADMHVYLPATRHKDFVASIIAHAKVRGFAPKDTNFMYLPEIRLMQDHRNEIDIIDSGPRAGVSISLRSEQAKGAWQGLWRDLLTFTERQGPSQVVVRCEDREGQSHRWAKNFRCL